MNTVVLSYPYLRPSLEPARLSARLIWQLAAQVRDEVCRHPRAPQVDVAEIIAGTRRLMVNGLAFETHWACDEAVVDDGGRAVLGSTQHEPGSGTAAIALNGSLIGERDDLWRSTAAHELGHAVFDAPAWIAAGAAHGRLRLKDEFDPRPSHMAVMDWCEWRANEFMGAFLAPRRLLRDHLLRKAVDLGLPLTCRGHGAALPVLDGGEAGPDGVEAIALELAEVFGLSLPFIHVRLRKYRLVANG